MANTYPTWVSYQAIIAGRLISLDKLPGVCQVGIREIIQRILGEYVLKACG